MLDLIIIQIIIVFIIDISGIIPEIKKTISRILTKGRIITDNYSLKPLDCSLCCQFWIGLIYSIIIGKFSLLTLLIIIMLSFLTPITANIFYLVKDILIKLNDTIYKILHL